MCRLQVIIISALLCGFLYLSPRVLAQQGAGSIDRSVTVEKIEKESLLPKKEVWVLDFWASWCGPCMQSLPHLKDVYARYKDKGVKLISLSHDRSAEAWERTILRTHMDWPHILLDGSVNQDFLNAKFPHPYIPTIFVIDREGKVEKVSQVYKLEEYLDRALAK